MVFLRRNYLRMRIDWHFTGDACYPYEAEVRGVRLVIRVNDWPDEPFMYTLLIDGEADQNVEDWPRRWTRPA